MGRSAEEIKKDIESGNTALGIEFGSTRIKAVLTDGTTAPIAQGSYEWENRLENGIWTYSLEDIWKGLKDCYADLAADVKKQYGLTLKKVGGAGDHPEGLSDDSLFPDRLFRRRQKDDCRV